MKQVFSDVTFYGDFEYLTLVSIGVKLGVLEPNSCYSKRLFGEDDLGWKNESQIWTRRGRFTLGSRHFQTISIISLAAMLSRQLPLFAGYKYGGSTIVGSHFFAFHSPGRSSLFALNSTM